MRETSSFCPLTNIDLNSRALVQGKDWGCLATLPASASPLSPEVINPGDTGHFAGRHPWGPWSDWGLLQLSVSAPVRRCLEWALVLLWPFLLFLFPTSHLSCSLPLVHFKATLVSTCFKGNLLEIGIAYFRFELPTFSYRLQVPSYLNSISPASLEAPGDKAYAPSLLCVSLKALWIHYKHPRKEGHCY